MLSDEIDNFSKRYRDTFLRGIPRLFNDDGAYLSFGCIFSGAEALAGYRYPNEPRNGLRFKQFIGDYFDPQYHPLADKLWELRNSVIHGFSPKHFALCHGQTHMHMVKSPPYVAVLNAENTFEALHDAAEKYLADLAASTAIQQFFETHLKSVKGGGFYVH